MKQNYFSLLLVLFCLSNTLFAQNNAIDLAGTTNYISIPNTYSLNSNAFTVEFDFYMNSLQNYNGGVTSTSTINSNIPEPLDFYVDNTGQANVVLGNGSQFETINLTTLSAGQWYHIAIIVDNVTLRAHINGNLAALSLISVPLSSTGNIRIGDRMDGATNANARFDNVRIWSVARSATEIQNNINSCLIGNETGLDIYYTFENISGNTVVDIASNNGSQNGTIVGTTSNTTGTNCTPSVPAAPTTLYATQIFTGDNKTVSDLQATGNNIKWYYDAAGNSLLPNNYPLYDNLTYYASQTVTGVESTNLLPVTLKRVSNNTQIVPSTSTVANLVATTSTGATAKWFTTASGGTALSNTDVITPGTYYVEQVIPTTIQTLGSGFNSPESVAIQADGKIVVADTQSHLIKRMNADGSNIVTLASGLNFPGGLAIQSDGKILFTEANSTTIKRMNADGSNIETLGSGFSGPYGIAIQADGKIIITDANDYLIKRMDADGNNIVTLGSGFNSPTGVTVQADGKIVLGDTNNNAVKRMDSDGSNIVTLGSTFNRPFGVVIQADGKIVVADAINDVIKRMDADGTNIVTLASGFDRPFSIAIQNDGKIVVTDTYHDAIKRITEGSTSNRVAVQITTTSTTASYLNFDGNKDYIQLTHFEKPNEFTIEAWVKSDYENGNIVCWGKNSTDTSHTKLRVNDGDVDFYIYDYVNDINNTISSSISINSNWHHIAVVKNANTTNNLEIYIDGVLGVTGTVNIDITSDNLFIGARGYNNLAPGELFDGDLDEVRIWNTARTATEINDSKDCELLGNESGLLAYYTFNQGYDQANNSTVTTLINSVSGGSNGVLNNFNLYGTTSNWLHGSPLTSGVTCASLGNSSFSNFEDFLVYPNPSSGIFNIDTDQEIEIRVFDILGKEIITKTNRKTIDISSYYKGVYYLEIISKDGGKSLHKLVKK
ncbi:conserved exported hypothetical protein [Flavobacterium sp. 9AF]|uniref:LamG-like jellyroll fold domain-containing protein n=1 Tax=Flavobacterium sp. 9AF TaxID=2653142 RepID=UPI0012F40BB5|nr:LamG-like jellyroll fold domain-containing protein [Flavobacterium sp. 9AF]VXB24105.1 conserved exported hypothetical protein [Flavobacterium sp. 9AF]